MGESVNLQDLNIGDYLPSSTELVIGWGKGDLEYTPLQATVQLSHILHQFFTLPEDTYPYSEATALTLIQTSKLAIRARLTVEGRVWYTIWDAETETLTDHLMYDEATTQDDYQDGVYKNICGFAGDQTCQMVSQTNTRFFVLDTSDWTASERQVSYKYRVHGTTEDGNEFPDEELLETLDDFGFYYLDMDAAIPDPPIVEVEEKDHTHIKFSYDWNNEQMYDYASIDIGLKTNSEIELDDNSELDPGEKTGTFVYDNFEPLAASADPLVLKFYFRVRHQPTEPPQVLVSEWTEELEVTIDPPHAPYLDPVQPDELPVIAFPFGSPTMPDDPEHYCAIDGVEVKLDKAPVLPLTRKDDKRLGRISFINDREERYEPTSVVDFNIKGNVFQFIIQSSRPMKHKTGKVEHEILLTEPFDIFEGITPSSRSFTRLPFFTVRDILNIYAEENAFYDDFKWDYVDMGDFDAEMPNKEYDGWNMANIIADLFRRIDAKPRAVYNHDTETWIVYAEKYSSKRNELTLHIEGDQTEANDIDYATEIKSNVKNAVNERIVGAWFPSEDGYITPRGASYQIRTSEQRYLLDHPIIEIEQVLVLDVQLGVGEVQKMGIVIPFIAGVLTRLGADHIFEVDTTIYMATPVIEELDITNWVVASETYDALVQTSKFNPHFGLFQNNAIVYDFGGKDIYNLFRQESKYLGLTEDINILKNAIIVARNEQILEEYEDFEFIPFLASAVLTDLNDIKIRVKYKSQRGITMNIEKGRIGNEKKRTVSHNQGDSMVDIGRYQRNLATLADRIGHPIQRYTETRTMTEDLTLLGGTEGGLIGLGDYVGNRIVVDVRYTFEKDHVNCVFDLAKHFAPINSEYSISREPSAFTINRKRVSSNLVYKEYIVASETDDTDDAHVTATGKQVALNMFETNSATFNARNKPMIHGFFNQVIDTTEYNTIHMPGMTSGNKHAMLFHVGFEHQIVGGYAKQKEIYDVKFFGLFKSEYWANVPVVYAHAKSGILQYAKIRFGGELNMWEDDEDAHFYPLVDDETTMYFDTGEKYPIQKDTNASLAFTLELITISDSDNIGVRGGFGKYNNLVIKHSAMPNVIIYSSETPYTDADDQPRDGDTLDEGASYVLDGNKLTISDTTHDNWCLEIDGEIVIWANDVRDIFFNFKEVR